MEKATDLPLDKQTAKMAKVSKAHLKYAINKYMQSEPEPEPTPTDMGMKVYLGVQADEEQADGEEMDETSFQKQTRDEELEPEGHTGRVDTYAGRIRWVITRYCKRDD